MLRITFCLVAVAAFHAAIGPGSAFAQAEQKARITIGKDTTFVTEPVDAEGYINYVAAIDRKLREGVTAENNANVPIRLMLGERELSERLKGQYYALLGIPAPEDPQSRIVSQGDILAEFGRDRIEELGEVMRNPWVEGDSDLAASWISRNTGVIADIRAAAARPQWYSPALPQDGRMVEVLLPDVQNARIVVRLLTANAMLNLGNKREGVALNDLLACHRLAGHIGNGWTLIELLVSCALGNVTYRAEESYLNFAQPNRAKQLFWKRKLATVRKRKSSAELVGFAERCMMLDVVTSMARGGDIREVANLLGVGPNAGAGIGPEIALTLRLRAKHPNVDYDQIMINLNKRYDNFVDILKEPNMQRRETRFAEFEKAAKDAGEKIAKVSAAELLASEEAVTKFIERFVTTNLTPAYSQAQKAELRCLALGDVITVGWGLSAWYSEHKKWPESLNQLVPKYLDSVPNDRFTGKPVSFIKQGTTCRVYSVGPDLKDDGGTDLEPTNGSYDIGIELRR